MQGEEFILAIVAMAMGTGIITVAIAKFTDLFKTWINRNNSSIKDEAFDRLAKAFMQHKKEMEQRMQNVEAIVADGDEIDHLPEIEAQQNDDILTNDLEHKKRVRS